MFQDRFEIVVEIDFEFSLSGLNVSLKSTRDLFNVGAMLI